MSFDPHRVVDEHDRRLAHAVTAPIPDHPDAEVIMDGMMRWEPGTLSSRTMNRMLMDLLADLWSDEYRRGGDFTAQLKRYNERVNNAHSAATDGRWHADR